MNVDNVKKRSGISMPSKKLLIKKKIGDIMLLRNPLSTRGGGEGFRVLMYHSITDDIVLNESYQLTTSKAVFEAQIRFLHENNYRVLSCEELIDHVAERKVFPPRSVALTFDDGFKDNLRNAKPILERYGYRAMIFLTTDYIGKDNEYLDWQDLNILQKNSTFSFGCHTVSHKRLLGLGPQELHSEIAGSKKILESRLGVPVDLFAYPFGSYGSFDGRAVGLLKKAGYRAAFTTIFGINKAKSDRYTLHRIQVSSCDDNKEFEKKLSGAYDWYRLWQRIIRTPELGRRKE